MKFSIGDKVMIKADAEELQNQVIEMVDGQIGTISEIYQNSYEPEVDRFEVELEEPIEYNGETLRVVPGLYEDNIDLIDRMRERGKPQKMRGGRLTEMYVMSFSDLLKRKKSKV